MPLLPNDFLHEQTPVILLSYSMPFPIFLRDIEKGIPA
jgi:hypothetical protein